MSSTGTFEDKSFLSEFGKPKIWLDSGIMISLEGGKISAILYRTGFFRKWKVINSSSSVADFDFAERKVINSFGKTAKTQRGKMISVYEASGYSSAAISFLRRYRSYLNG